MLRSILALALLAPFAHAQPLSVASPDGSLRLTFEVKMLGDIAYRVERLGQPLITSSKLGVVLTGGKRLDIGFRLLDSVASSRDETWETVWGERQYIRDHHNELRLQLRTIGGVRMDIVARVFDDGVGFRYVWPDASLGAFEIADERTEFNFAAEPTAWWIPAYQRERYEYLFRHTPLGEAGTFQADVNVDTPSVPDPYRPDQVVHTPLTLELPNGSVAAIHEASLVDFASMTLEVAGPTSLKADLVPWSTGVKVYAEAPHASPWRVILVGDTPGDLAESDLVLNLNEPSKIAETSWIEPQKYVGIWWEMHLDTHTWHSGDRHGATTERAKRLIDFAADNGFGGVLVEGWNQGWDGNWIGPSADISFTEPYPDFDLEGVARYGVERGARLIGHHETGGDVPSYDEQLEDAFALYGRLGVRAVKTGYVSWERGLVRTEGPGLAPGDSTFEWHHGQWMVRHYQRTVETAARHGVMVNIHEPIKDTGLRRTWPNLMTREGTRGQEYNAWSRDGGNPPEHETALPFTRLLSGPLDFTPGIFDLLFEEAKPDNRVRTTLAKQLALYVVLYSPLQMAADLPANYEARPDAFQFIRDVPADWADSRVLHAEIGDVATFVRKDRHSDDWYLGSVTDEYGRSLEAPLHFLDADRAYVAEVYRDSDDADWEANPYGLVTEHGLVDAATVLPIRLAPGGGLAVRFRPATDEEVQTMPRLVTD